MRIFEAFQGRSVTARGGVAGFVSRQKPVTYSVRTDSPVFAQTEILPENFKSRAILMALFVNKKPRKTEKFCAE